jgi:hypothetical protein
MGDYLVRNSKNPRFQLGDPRILIRSINLHSRVHVGDNVGRCDTRLIKGIGVVEWNILHRKQVWECGCLESFNVINGI